VEGRKEINISIINKSFIEEMKPFVEFILKKNLIPIQKKYFKNKHKYTCEKKFDLSLLIKEKLREKAEKESKRKKRIRAKNNGGFRK